MQLPRHMQNICRTHTGHMQNTCRAHAEHTQNTHRIHTEHTQNTHRTHTEHTQNTHRTHTEHTQNTHITYACSLDCLFTFQLPTTFLIAQFNTTFTVSTCLFLLVPNNVLSKTVLVLMIPYACCSMYDLISGT